jgi:hypothetical protein
MTKKLKTLGVVHNEEELAVIEWLKAKLKRTASGAYKWMAAEKAAELGYAPKGSKKVGEVRNK